MKISVLQEIIKIELKELGLESETLRKVQDYSTAMYLESSTMLRLIMKSVFTVLNVISLLRYGKIFVFLNEQQQYVLWRNLNGLIGFAQMRIFLRTTSLLRFVEVDLR